MVSRDLFVINSSHGGGTQSHSRIFPWPITLRGSASIYLCVFSCASPSHISSAKLHKKSSQSCVYNDI